MQITIKERQGFGRHIVQLIIAISIGCGLLMASENKAVPEVLGIAFSILGFIILIGCYLSPTWIAADYSKKIPEIKKLKEENDTYEYLRIKHPKYLWILTTNVVFGWLGITWLIAFTMATKDSLVVNVPDDVAKDSGLIEEHLSDSSPEAENAHYERAMNELETNNFDKALWAKSFSLCDGDENRSKAKYISFRVQQLSGSVGTVEDEQQQQLQVEQENPEESEQQ